MNRAIAFISSFTLKPKFLICLDDKNNVSHCIVSPPSEVFKTLHIICSAYVAEMPPYSYNDSESEDECTATQIISGHDLE